MKSITFLKRIPAFLLTILILMSLLPVTPLSAYGEEAIVTVNEEVGAAGRDLLVGLDMLSTPQADLSTGISRADFALLLAEMMRYAGFETPATGYRDVDSGAKNAAAIGFVVEQGYMSGEKGLFRPDDAVTYLDAVRAFVELTGNNLTRNLTTASTYLIKATGLGICKGITAQGSDAVLSAGAAYKMAANALTADSMKMAAITGSYISEVETGDFLSVMHDIERISGLLTKTRHAGVYTAGGTGSASVEIDQIRFKAVEDWSELLGCMVYAYVDYRSVDAEILHMLPTGDNDVVKLKAEDILSVNSAKTEITYTSEEDEDEEETMALSLATLVVWNGSYGGTLVNYEAHELALRSAAGDPKTGSVRLIDYNDDGTCDVMVIMSYEIYYTTTADQQKERLVDATGKIFEMNRYPESDRFLSYESGGEATFEVFDKEQIIQIAESRDGSIVTAVIGEKSVEATVTEIRNSSSGTEYLVDGVWYTGNDYFCENYTDAHRETADNLSVGWHGYFLLDIDGRIAALQPQSEAYYGYLVDISVPKGLAIETQAKIFSNYKTEEEAHEMLALELAAKVRVDAGDGYGYKSIKENEIRGLGVFKKPDGSFNHQLVRYTVNKSDEISSLQAADQTRTWSGTDFLSGRPDDSRWFNDYAEFALSYDASDGGTITSFTADNALRLAKADGSYTNAVYFAETFVIDKGATPLWVIPPESSIQDDTLYDYAEFGDYALGTYPNVRVYDLKKDGSAGHVVWQPATVSSSSVDWESWRTVFVTDIRRVLNSDGEETTQLTGYRNTRYSNEKMGIITLTAVDKDLLSEVKEGDLIQYVVDTKNRVTHMQRLFSYRDGQVGYSTTQPLRTKARVPGAQSTAQGYGGTTGLPYWGKILFNNINGVTLTFARDADDLPTAYGTTATVFTKTNYFEWIVYDTVTGNAWLDKQPTTYGVADVASADDATDCLVLAGGNTGISMGVLYLK